MRNLMSSRKIWRGLVILACIILITLFTCEWKTVAHAYLRRDPELKGKFKLIDAVGDFSKPLININDVGIIKPRDKCYDYLKEAVMNRTVFYNVFKAKTYRPMCLLTHFTMERLSMFEHLLNRWGGCISVALYVENRDYQRDVKIIKDILTTKNRTSNIFLHVVLKDGKYYPINYLRNVAQKGATSTKYLFQVDIDFIPAKDLYESLLHHVYGRTIKKYGKHAALVVPAFEMSSKFNKSEEELEKLIPQNKEDLLKALQEKMITPMHQGKNTNEAHFATDFKKWKSATQPYKVKYRKGFEPYVLLPKKTTPPFITLFLQRYGNKVSYLMELDARGFDFVVLPDAFIIHLPHKSLDSKELFKEVGPCTSLIYRILVSKAKKIKEVL